MRHISFSSFSESVLAQFFTQFQKKLLTLKNDKCYYDEEDYFASASHSRQQINALLEALDLVKEKAIPLFDKGQTPSWFTLLKLKSAFNPFAEKYKEVFAKSDYLFNDFSVPVKDKGASDSLNKDNLVKFLPFDIAIHRPLAYEWVSELVLILQQAPDELIKLLSFLNPTVANINVPFVFNLKHVPGEQFPANYWLFSMNNQSPINAEKYYQEFRDLIKAYLLEKLQIYLLEHAETSYVQDLRHQAMQLQEELNKACHYLQDFVRQEELKYQALLDTEVMNEQMSFAQSASALIQQITALKLALSTIDNENCPHIIQLQTDYLAQAPEMIIAENQITKHLDVILLHEIYRQEHTRSTTCLAELKEAINSKITEMTHRHDKVLQDWQKDEMQKHGLVNQNIGNELDALARAIEQVMLLNQKTDFADRTEIDEESVQVQEKCLMLQNQLSLQIEKLQQQLFEQRKNYPQQLVEYNAHIPSLIFNLYESNCSTLTTLKKVMPNQLEVLNLRQQYLHKMRVAQDFKDSLRSANIETFKKILADKVQLQVQQEADKSKEVILTQIEKANLTLDQARAAIKETSEKKLTATKSIQESLKQLMQVFVLLDSEKYSIQLDFIKDLKAVDNSMEGYHLWMNKLVLTELTQLAEDEQTWKNELSACQNLLSILYAIKDCVGSTKKKIPFEQLLKLAPCRKQQKPLLFLLECLGVNESQFWLDYYRTQNSIAINNRSEHIVLFNRLLISQLETVTTRRDKALQQINRANIYKQQDKKINEWHRIFLGQYSEFTTRKEEITATQMIIDNAEQLVSKSQQSLADKAILKIEITILMDLIHLMETNQTLLTALNHYDSAEQPIETIDVEPIMEQINNASVILATLNQKLLTLPNSSNYRQTVKSSEETLNKAIIHFNKIIHEHCRQAKKQLDGYLFKIENEKNNFAQMKYYLHFSRGSTLLQLQYQQLLALPENNYLDFNGLIEEIAKMNNQQQRLQSQLFPSFEQKLREIIINLNKQHIRMSHLDFNNEHKSDSQFKQAVIAEAEEISNAYTTDYLKEFKASLQNQSLPNTQDILALLNQVMIEKNKLDEVIQTHKDYLETINQRIVLRNNLVKEIKQTLDDYLIQRQHRFFIKDKIWQQDKQQRQLFINKLHLALDHYNEDGLSQPLIELINQNKARFPGHHLQPLLNRINLYLYAHEKGTITERLSFNEMQTKLAKIKQENLVFVNRFETLYEQIVLMQAYGNTLLAEDNEVGVAVINLAFQLQQHADSFIKAIPDENKLDLNSVQIFQNEFSNLLHSQDEVIGKHSDTGKDILAKLFVAIFSLLLAPAIKLIPAKYQGQASLFFEKSILLQKIDAMDNVLITLNV